MPMPPKASRCSLTQAVEAYADKPPQGSRLLTDSGVETCADKLLTQVVEACADKLLHCCIRQPLRGELGFTFPALRPAK